MKVKYVIINDLCPRLCSLAEEHAQLAKGERVTSAGFCQFSKDAACDDEWEVTCWGESIGLKVKSNPEHDAYLIGRLLAD